MSLAAGRRVGLAPGPVPGGEDVDRRRLRQLDACLGAIETETENGRRTLAGKLALHVPGVVAGMTAGEAQDLIVWEQAMCLRRRVGRPLLRGETSTPSNPSEVHGDPSPAGGAIAPRVAFASDDLGDLGTADARRLTDQIRAGVRELSVLVLEAHQGRAWLALGYPTWSQYVREEFGFSPSRSYQLLDHARVVQALSRAAGLSKVLDISPYTADRVRPWLEEILATVRDRTRDLSETDARLSVLALVREVVGTNLHRPSSADVRELVPLLELASVLHRLRASLERISRLPFAAWLAAEPSAAAELDDLLVPAGRWLAELESELRSKRPDAS